MSRTRVMDRRRDVEEEGSRENYKALVAEDISYLESRKQIHSEVSAVHHMSEVRNQTLKEKIKAVKAEIEEQRKLRLPQKPAIRTEEDLRSYCDEYEKRMGEYTVRKQTLAFLLTYSAADFKKADLSVVSRWLDTWGPFFTEAEAACKNLKRIERNTPNAELYVPPTRELYEVLDEVCRLQLQARSLVGRERYRRSAYDADSVEDFLDNEQQLLDWCRKQRMTLDGLSSFDDLQEFSTSFHANVPVMDSNFIVLSEQCEVLAQNREVQEAMREVNNAWIDLCLSTYEKLHNTARDENRASGVEGECAYWVSSMSPRVQLFLRRVMALLEDKDDDLHGAPDTANVLKRCTEVMREREAHQVVSIHLADFDVREECVQPHFDALKKEMRSELTSTVLSFPSIVDYDGRLEYKNRVEELREWIDVKSQKGTYVKLLERLEETKIMIQEYADALFPEAEGAKE